MTISKTELAGAIAFVEAYRSCPTRYKKRQEAEQDPQMFNYGKIEAKILSQVDASKLTTLWKNMEERNAKR